MERSGSWLSQGFRKGREAWGEDINRESTRRMFFQRFPGFIEFCSVGQSPKHKIPGNIQLEKCITHRGHCFYPAPLPALSSTVPGAGRNPRNSQLATKTFTLRTGTPPAIPSIQEATTNVVGAFKEIPATLPPYRTVAPGKGGKKGGGDFLKSMDCVQLPLAIIPVMALRGYLVA